MVEIAMMGAHQPHEELFSYKVNLEKRVPADHPLRALARELDLSWVRGEVAGFYGHNGHVSTDPVIIVKMMLLLLLDNVPSERELLKIIPVRLDYLWFLGYGLDDKIPDHSVLSKARARWGPAVFSRVFERTVEQCVAKGLVSGERLHIDSSVIKAAASKDSIEKMAPEWVAAWRAAARRQEAKLEIFDPEAEADTKSVNATHVSKTDPEATLTRGPGIHGAQLSHKSHRAVDDAHGVITAVETTTGAAPDGRELPKLLAEHERVAGARPRTVVGDHHYGTASNYHHCAALGVTPHLKPSLGSAEGRGVMAAEKFQYDAAGDCYRCPAGHHLRRRQEKEGFIIYRIEHAQTCANCALRAQCTRSPRGRSIRRPLGAETIEASRAAATSLAARESYRRRKIRAEGSFADAANNHGFKRARWRGLWRQKIQDLLVAAAQNLRLLARRSARGPSARLEKAMQRVWMALTAEISAQLPIPSPTFAATSGPPHV